MTTYIVPDNPADPAAAALELILRLPAKYGGPACRRVGLNRSSTAAVDRGSADRACLRW